jgi:hypothetical protein
MATFRIAVNMEFVRSADTGFEDGVKIADGLGCRYSEAMVHTGWEPFSEVHDFHSYSMEQDNLLMREICARHGVRAYEGLARVRDAVYHVHAEELSMRQGAAERGKVTGTPVGGACGDGVVDGQRVCDIPAPLDREIFFSVECGTIEQAARSLDGLRKVMGPHLAEG